MITPGLLLLSANQLCRERHNLPTNNACRTCFLEVFEKVPDEAIGEAYPEMKREEFFELMQEWRMAGQEDDIQ